MVIPALGVKYRCVRKEFFFQFYMILEVTYYNVDGNKAVPYKIKLIQIDV